jgi:diguanylate cyclase (GGDEF)-like protein
VLLTDRLDQALLTASREELSVGLLAIDLDGFKRVNDTLGHHAGDQLLSLAAARMRKVIRATDTCARVGGDEFVVLLPRTTAMGISRLTDSLRAACAQPFILKGGTVTIGASVGAALSPQDGTRPDVLFRVADARMYEAKPARRTP